MMWTRFCRTIIVLLFQRKHSREIFPPRCARKAISLYSVACRIMRGVYNRTTLCGPMASQGLLKSCSLACDVFRCAVWRSNSVSAASNHVTRWETSQTALQAWLLLITRRIIQPERRALFRLLIETNDCYVPTSNTLFCGAIQSVNVFAYHFVLALRWTVSHEYCCN